MSSCLICVKEIKVTTETTAAATDQQLIKSCYLSVYIWRSRQYFVNVSVLASVT